MNPLLLKYLNSVKLFEAPNDQGTKPPEKPEIKIDSVDNRNDKDGTLDPDAPVDDEDDKDPDADPDPEPEPDAAKTDEEKLAEKEERRQGRIQKRIDKLTATVGTKDAEIAELKKQLAEKPVEGLTEEEVNRRAESIAAAKLKDAETAREQKAFEKSADALIKNASKVDKDFEKKINDVAKETDTLMPKYMVEILSDLDNENGHEILAQLANDEDLYEEICTLSERKMTQRLIRMSDKLKDSGKKPIVIKERERRIPDPIEPISDGNNNRGNSLPSKPTQNMDEWVRVRALQSEQFRKSRGR